METLEKIDISNVLTFSDISLHVGNQVSLLDSDKFPFDENNPISACESISNFIDQSIIQNKIEWIVYDLSVNTIDKLQSIVFSSYIPRYLYNKYHMLKFVFLTNGNVYGDANWGNASELQQHSPIDFYAKIISTGELQGDRVWLLRSVLFDEGSLNFDFVEDKVYYGSVNNKYSLITKLALSSIIRGLIENYTEIKEGDYHIIPKDTQTEYQLLNYVAWKKNQKTYIERSSSIVAKESILKSVKLKELKKIWELAGYPEIPTFKELFDKI